MSPNISRSYKIKVGNGLPIAAELNVAQRALDGGTTGGKQRGDQGAERAKGVGSWAAGLAYDKNLDRPQLPHLHIKIEALVNVADCVMDMLLNLCVRQTGNVNLAYLGEVDRTGTIDGKLRVEIDLPPDANDQLIPRSEDVIGRDIHFAQRSKGRWHLAKEAVAIDRKQCAQGAPHQQLEIRRS